MSAPLQLFCFVSSTIGAKPTCSVLPVLVVVEPRVVSLFVLHVGVLLPARCLRSDLVIHFVPLEVQNAYTKELLLLLSS